MAAKLVEAKCNICDIQYSYVFGVVTELIAINEFLRIMIREQRNGLESLETCTEIIKKIFEKSDDYNQMNNEEKSVFIEKTYKFITEFFNDQEKEIFANEIIIKASSEIYPYVNFEDVKEEREVQNLPLITIETLNKKQYIRTYPGLSYVNFSNDRKLILCPKDLQLSAIVQEQKDI